MTGEFFKELECLINKYSMENASNTPDFILAEYLSGCLSVFDTAIQQREMWYGRDARPSLIGKEVIDDSARSIRKIQTSRPKFI